MGLDIAIGANGTLPQIDCVKGVAATVGRGLTVMPIVFMVVSQPSAEAVILKVVVCGILVRLVNVPAIEEPIPEFAIPVKFDVLVLVQL